MKCKVLNRIIRGLHDLGNGLLLKLERGDLKFFFLCPLVNTTHPQFLDSNLKLFWIKKRVELVIGIGMGTGLRVEDEV